MQFMLLYASFLVFRPQLAFTHMTRYLKVSHYNSGHMVLLYIYYVCHVCANCSMNDDWLECWRCCHNSSWMLFDVHICLMANEIVQPCGTQRASAACMLLCVNQKVEVLHITLHGELVYAAAAAAAAAKSTVAVAAVAIEEKRAKVLRLLEWSAPFDVCSTDVWQKCSSLNYSRLYVFLLCNWMKEWICRHTKEIVGCQKAPTDIKCDVSNFFPNSWTLSLSSTTFQKK